MLKRLPSLESLRYVEACVRHGNFTRAAAELGITPAAVSLRIRDLEAELGTALFRRSGPKIEPTRSGIVLASRLSEALGVIRSAVENCRGGAQPLRVTSVPTLAMRWLTPRLARYHELPDAAPVALDVSAELRAGELFDIAIRTGLGGWRDYQSTALIPVEATPMLSPALAVRTRLSCPEDLAALPLLPYDEWPRWFREAGAQAPALQFYADDYPTHERDAAAAIEGAGVALLSPILFDALLRDGKLIQPFAHVMQGPARHYVLLKPGEARPDVLRFRDWLLQEAAATANPAPAVPSSAGTPD